jgi:hypothetical protein
MEYCRKAVLTDIERQEGGFMQSEEIVKKVKESFEKRKQDIESIKIITEAFIENVLFDCQDILVELDTFKKFTEVLVEVLDQYTHTGIFDPIDSLLLNQGITLILSKNPQPEVWYQKMRKKVIDFIEAGK